jgi:hypothetical protein
MTSKIWDDGSLAPVTDLVNPSQASLAGSCPNISRYATSSKLLESQRSKTEYPRYSSDPFSPSLLGSAFDSTAVQEI